MSIDMTTVKQIMHNNKEVAKIEDLNGNIMWQKPSSITYPYLFMSNNNALYNKDINVEWTWTSGTPGPVSNPQGQYYWSDGTNLYYSDNNNQYVYTGSELDNYDSTKWVSKSNWPNIYGNDIIKINGELYALNSTSGSYLYNSSTDTWSPFTITGAGSGMKGDTIWTDGTDIYWNISDDTIRVLDQIDLSWGSNIIINITNSNAYYYWTDGTDVYYSNGNTQRVWDKANRNWVVKTWSGLTNFNGNEVFYYNGDIYVRSAVSSNYPIYKLSNGTWIDTYTNPGSTKSSFRGARMWDLGGRSTASTATWLTGLRRPNK